MRVYAECNVGSSKKMMTGGDKNLNEKRNGSKNVSPYAKYLHKEEGAGFVSLLLQLTHATGQY